MVKSLTTILVKHLKHCWYSFTCSHKHSVTYNQAIVLEVPKHFTAEDHLIAQIISVVVKAVLVWFLVFKQAGGSEIQPQCHLYNQMASKPYNGRKLHHHDPEHI